MPETNEQKSNGLAIASFVLALVWGFFCITLIWLSLWILCRILSLIFGIVALSKRQTKRASILWIIFSLIWAAIVIICTTVVWKFVVQHKDQFMDPINEFTARVEENPELAKLMENEEFSDKFEEVLEQRLQEKYWKEYSDINDVNGLMTVWGDLFEEMKNIVTELAGQEWITNEELIINNDEENEIIENDEELPSEVTVCDEFYKSEEEIVCTEQYEPVCGNNGQTYGNSCFACIEVDSYTDWECAETAPTPAAKLMVQEWQTEEETQAMIQETCTNAWGELVDGNCVLEDGSVIAF